MVKDAETHAEEDQRRRQELELRNKLDSLVYGTERTLTEHREKLAEADVAAMETALKEAREALGRNAPPEELEQAQQNLVQAAHRAAEALYRQAGEAGGGSAGATNGAPGPEAEAAAGGTGPGATAEQAGQGKSGVVDAEFEESK
jgi:molecular chaperone DnaK